MTCLFQVVQKPVSKPPPKRALTPQPSRRPSVQKPPSIKKAPTPPPEPEPEPEPEVERDPDPYFVKEDYPVGLSALKVQTFIFILQGFGEVAH